MPRTTDRALPRITTREDDVCAIADVLVLGGGPAGCWAAIATAESGASVVLVDKGHCGTSGATASAGVGVWYVPPDPERREAAMASREELGGHLADRGWMARVLDETYEQVGRLADWGYPFPVGEDGTPARTSLQGPEYMRRMRRAVARARVRIWDHSPALELLVTGDGAVAGATGVRRQRGGRWTVRAAATVVATGGCAFLSGGLGCDVLTGDGHLLAAEAGAELSGMEFSNAYAISPAFSSVTKTAFYHWATFTHEDGTELEGASSRSRSAWRAPCAAPAGCASSTIAARPRCPASTRPAMPRRASSSAPAGPACGRPRPATRICTGGRSSARCATRSIPTTRTTSAPPPA